MKQNIEINNSKCGKQGCISIVWYRGRERSFLCLCASTVHWVGSPLFNIYSIAWPSGNSATALSKSYILLRMSSSANLPAQILLTCSRPTSKLYSCNSLVHQRVTWIQFARWPCSWSSAWQKGLAVKICATTQSQQYVALWLRCCQRAKQLSIY